MICVECQKQTEHRCPRCREPLCEECEKYWVGCDEPLEPDHAADIPMDVPLVLTTSAGMSLVR